MVKKRVRLNESALRNIMIFCGKTNHFNGWMKAE